MSKIKYPITVGITTFNSADYVIKQLNMDYLKHLEGYVDEIIIQDDCSSDYEKLKPYQTNNIKVFTNSSNLSPLLNRVELLKNCKNEWVLLMDSDNYITFFSTDNHFWGDVVSKFDLDNKKIIYAPGSKYHYGHNKILEQVMDLKFFKDHLEDNTFYLQMMGNQGNYLVPKTTYLEVSKEIDTKYCKYIGEVLYFNYLWLKNNNTIICKSDFEYHHVIRQDGYTITNMEKTLQDDIFNEINNMFLNHVV